jgi:copper transport protein
MLSLGVASAHTALSGTSPGDGEVLDAPPQHVHLTFSGALEASAAIHTIGIIGPGREEVELASPMLSDNRKVLMAALPELPAGAYTVQYRVVSSDGHSIAGEFDFEVKLQPTEPSKADTAPTDEHVGHHPNELSSADGTSAWFAAGLFGSRILYYATLLPLLGWALWSAFQRLSIDQLAYWRCVGLLLQAAHLAVFVLHVAFHWAELTEGIASASFLAMLRDTTIGQSWLFTGLLSLAGFPLLFRYRAVDGGWVLAMVAAKTMRGHASAFEPVLWSRLADGVHVGAAAVWIGGLLALALLLRRSPEWLRIFAPTFSNAALVSFGVLAISGTLTTLLYTEQLVDLLRTTWGQLLLIKVILAIAVLPAAAWLRRGVRRANPQQSGRFRRLLFADAAILLGVIGLTGVLTHVSPMVERLPFHWHVMGEGVHLTADIEDVRPGNNTLSLKVWVPSGDEAPTVLATIEEKDLANPTGIKLVQMDIPSEEWESFQGFDKYTFTGDVLVEEPAAATLRVTIERANGEVHPYEKTLTNP